MKSCILILLVLTISLSCNQSDLSGIEVMKIDNNLVQFIINTSDKPTIDTARRKDFYYIEHYLNRKDSTNSVLLKDSLGNIVGIRQTMKGINLFVKNITPMVKAREK